MDFSWEKVHLDDETKTVSFIAVPDPRRYDTIEQDGETLYVDRYFGVAFGNEVFAQMAGQASGMPIHHAPRNISSAVDYAAARTSAVAKELETGEYVAPEPAPARHRPMENSEEKITSFISIDICGSTALRRSDAINYDTSHKLFMQEMTAAVGQFHASIVKLTGDGLIAYIDGPTINTSADRALDLGSSVLGILHGGLNPALKSAGLPRLSVRIGADIGAACVRQFGSPATGFSQAEVVSDALNRAVKIQEIAGTNEFWVGDDLRRCQHVQWLERLTLVEPAPAALEQYPCYRLD